MLLYEKLAIVQKMETPDLQLLSARTPMSWVCLKNIAKFKEPLSTEYAVE